MTSSLSRQLARWVDALQYQDIPAAVVNHARRMIADTVGVALAAHDDVLAPRLRSMTAGDVGKSAIWGSSATSSTASAALANGALAHALDYDDNNMTMIGHSSAPVVPALFALADEFPCSLEDLIVAYIAGVQVESLLGRIATLEHNGRGWHTTATLGTFGATAACARLLKLSEDQIVGALGIAASFAGGVRQNFNSMTKALHAGRAAANGVTAARLAQSGIYGSPLAIEGHEGFLELFAGVAGHSAPLTAGELGTFEVLQSFPKVYPTCSMVHQALDIVLDQWSKGKVSAEGVDHVVCKMSYHALNIMRYPQPTIPVEARFSVQYCIAVALLHGKVTNEFFSPAAIASPAIWDVMKKIKVELDPRLKDKASFEEAYLGGQAYTTIEFRYADGQTRTERAAIQRGHPDYPLTEEEFFRKFQDCTIGALGLPASQSLWNVLVAGDPTLVFRPYDYLSVR